MTNFLDFAPETMTGLMKAIKSDISTEFGEWWKKNKTAVSGAIRTVSQSAIETQKSLLKGHIGQELADIALQSQKAALRQVLRHTQLMSLILLQSLVNAIFKRIGWALLNRTGINFFPELVTPS
jgi:hypothetical protein